MNHLLQFFLKPTLPPYNPLEWARQPLHLRGRQVCQAWARDGYGTPLGIILLYGLKILLYILGWVWVCSFSPSLGSPTQLPQWWLEPLAFQKAILFSMLFEVLGLGCGSGPLTGRYLPPVGGFLYWLRLGTTKLPLFPGLPLLGAPTRSWLDISVYAGLLLSLMAAVFAPTLSASQLLPIVVLLPLAGILDKTLFLAARAEHYGLTCLAFFATEHWLPAAMSIQLALWFFAGVSKLNHHFPTVVAVMISNNPFLRLPWLRARMYQQPPDDLRPSRLATLMAHMGTLLELSVPLAFAAVPFGLPVEVGIGLMLLLHSFILSNVPMGVPLEWNVMVVYAGFALFVAHPETHWWQLDPPWLAATVLLCSVVLPVLGNLLPSRISFLVAMRYYAGNWPFSIYLFRGQSYRKLDRLVKTSPWVHDQLAPFYDEGTRVGLVGKVMGFRLMHLHGRVLPRILPHAVEDLAAYEWVDGELVAGLALGWNFGDGHLHHEQLLTTLQAQCSFEPGELRCIFVEAQPLQKQSLCYRIRDAATGLLKAGELSIADLRIHQPWENPHPIQENI
ncbi:MAG: DUF3556 domain-containing protein [Myxococcota bacterium]